MVWLQKTLRLSNCPARILTKKPPLNPSLPVLKLIHWLPIKYKIHLSMTRSQTCCRSRPTDFSQLTLPPLGPGGPNSPLLSISPCKIHIGSIINTCPGQSLNLKLALQASPSFCYSPHKTIK